MKMLVVVLISLVLCGHSAVAASTSGDAPAVRRFMLAVGANDGGPDRAPLRYAGHDAGAVAGVFETLGGVRDEDRVLLYDPTREALLASLRDLSDRMKTVQLEQGRVELFVYYSGHSDEKGLLLGEDHYEYRKLREDIVSLPADVRVVILDSCESGVLTRLKGGERSPAFLLDVTSDMEGHAFLTSSSENEAAQESDRIGGSFFTSALVSGLRGAADATGDGRVTLNEAYQFAFDHTLSETEATLAGPQHPAYDIRLVGAGDLVMTDIRGTSAGLHLGEDLEGRIHVRDDDGVLVVALQKKGGRTVELGLEAGDYDVIVSSSESSYHGRLSLRDGDTTTLSMEAMDPLTLESTVSRGSGGAPAAPIGGRAPVPSRKPVHSPTTSTPTRTDGLGGQEVRPFGQTNFIGSLQFMTGFPQGELHDQLGRDAYGLGAQVLFSPFGFPLGIGLDVTWMNYGHESREEPFSTTIPDVTVDVTTTNNLVQGFLVLRGRMPQGPIQLYGDALIGFNYLFTETSISDVDGFEDVASTTNTDDGAFAYGLGGGVGVPLFTRWRTSARSDHPVQVLLDIGGRYIWGDEVSYLKEGSIRRDNGVVTYDTVRSRSDLVRLQVGVSCKF